ncbi:hypothetical protein [Croceicoccus naphthovorans]|uniref:Uncharacterized protein n=1 Tax=Croceicoccus naphthovorans TaxID=1348774 RepID=A0A0G3XGX6_9SPHN|nr:hypothetical protein [Croceicoccus naphthovorans]AKM09891.1 hypothetical protein AB433_07675 [Croceicoccus naphthovorans]MBB3991355.1 hypothetical protein [Croceicoccus naphthovorans]
MIRAGLILAAIVLALVGALWATGHLDVGGRKASEAEIATGQADAAIKSGADAANTSADNERADAQTDKDVEDAKTKIDAASARRDPVGSGRAARDGLCRADPDYCE